MNKFLCLKCGERSSVSAEITEADFVCMCGGADSYIYLCKHNTFAFAEDENDYGHIDYREDFHSDG